MMVKMDPVTEPLLDFLGTSTPVGIFMVVALPVCTHTNEDITE